MITFPMINFKYFDVKINDINVSEGSITIKEIDLTLKSLPGFHINDDGPSIELPIISEFIEEMEKRGIKTNILI